MELKKLNGGTKMGKHSPAIREIRSIAQEEGYFIIGQDPDNQYRFIMSNGFASVSLELLGSAGTGLMGRLIMRTENVSEADGVVARLKETLAERNYSVFMDELEIERIRRPYETE